MGWSSRQKLNFVLCGLTYFCGGMQVSIVAPFYPREAEKKGATSMEYGMVFGIYELCIFLTSPIMGCWVANIGPRTTFLFGLVASSVSAIAFGLLDSIQEKNLFIILCLLTRGFEAVGAAAYMTGVNSLIPIEFPNTAGTVLSSLEILVGFGMFVGSLLGGYLYQLGGFPLPFIVTGIVLLFVGLLAALTIPKPKKVKAEECGDDDSKRNMVSLIKVPSILLVIASLTMATSATGFVAVALEPHLRSLSLSPLALGAVFVIEGVTFCVTAPIIGRFCDKGMLQPMTALWTGSLFIFISGVIVGPVFFIPLEKSLWITGFALIAQGLGVGMIYTSSFSALLDLARESGFDDSISTYGIISGVWGAASSFGVFLGSSVCGILQERFPLPWSSLYIVMTQTILIAVLPTTLFKVVDTHSLTK